MNPFTVAEAMLDYTPRDWFQITASWTVAGLLVAAILVDDYAKAVLGERG